MLITTRDPCDAHAEGGNFCVNYAPECILSKMNFRGNHGLSAWRSMKNRKNSRKRQRPVAFGAASEISLVVFLIQFCQCWQWTHGFNHLVMYNAIVNRDSGDKN